MNNKERQNLLMELNKNTLVTYSIISPGLDISADHLGKLLRGKAPISDKVINKLLNLHEVKIEETEHFYVSLIIKKK